MPSGRKIQFSERLLGILIGLFPPSFRRSVGAALLDSLRDSCHEEWERRRWLGLLRFWLRTALELSRDAMLEWLDYGRQRWQRANRRSSAELYRRRDTMGAILQDIHFAFRSFLKKPLFYGSAIITLGLGVGATTTIFSVVDGVLLRPLPYDSPEELVQLWSTFGDTEYDSHSFPNFDDVRSASTVFASLVALEYTTRVLAGEGEPKRLEAGGASDDLFSLLGTRPLLGRGFTADDHKPGASPVAVLSYGLWQSRWGGGSGIIGRTVTVDQQSVTVVGVLPRDFLPPEPVFPADVDIWFPLSVVRPDLSNRDEYALQVIARLAPGVAVTSAQQQMDLIAAGLAEAYPAANTSAGGPLGIRLMSLQESTIGNIGNTLIVLVGAVGFLLFMACANVANLLLARGADREREMALRTALGAGRTRVLRQLLTESTFLALLGGGLGAGLAFVGVHLFAYLDPGNIPRMAEVSVDLRVLTFALALSLLTGVLFGLAPAMYMSGASPSHALKESARTATSGRRASTLRSALVMTQMAAALILVIGAGLLINSFIRLASVDPGFDPEGLVIMRVEPGPGYQSPQTQMAFFDELQTRVQAIPGASSTSLAVRLPVSRFGSWGRITTDGATERDSEEPRYVRYNSISPNHFRTLGIPLLRGRDINATDRANSDPVVIINERLAREYWPDGEALGRRLKFGASASQSPWRTVAGIVGDVKQRGLGNPGESELYVPYPQRPRSVMYVAARAEREEAKIIPELRQAVWSIDSHIPLDRIITMEERLATSLTTPRFYTVLLSIFAAVALILAAIGIYGTISYAVAQRTREVGVRIALGADAAHVFGLILRRGLTLSMIGILVGVAGALGVSRFLSSFVYGITTTDVSTFFGVSLLLLLVALTACYLPARRATRVDPVMALRAE